MRTQGAFYADTPHIGGFIVYGADDIWGFGSLTRTRTAPGNYALTMGAAASGQALVSLEGLKRLTVYPSLQSLPFQEQFGSSSGAGYPANSGLPPYTGASELVPPTAPPAKGLRIKTINVVSQITGAALSAHTPSLNRTVYANNTALAITNIPISGTLPTAVQTNPYVTTLTVNSPVFETTDLSDVTFDIAVTTATGGSYSLYAVILYVDFNYN